MMTKNKKGSNTAILGYFVSVCDVTFKLSDNCGASALFKIVTEEFFQLVKRDNIRPVVKVSVDGVRNYH